jgi:hypothetical protein
MPAARRDPRHPDWSGRALPGNGKFAVQRIETLVFAFIHIAAKDLFTGPAQRVLPQAQRPDFQGNNALITFFSKKVLQPPYMGLDCLSLH